MAVPIKLFIAYAREDEVLKDQLVKRLRVLQRQGLIAPWHDRDISAGSDWQHDIDTNLKGAEIILLLVSPDFIDSDYCYDVEMTKAMARHQTGEAVVIPIILRSCLWGRAPFGHLQALPSDALAVTLWPNQDAAWHSIAERIAQRVEEVVEAKAEAERQAKAKAEAERQAKIKAEAERQAKAKAEAERQAKAKAEAERQAKIKAEAERQAKAKAEAERQAKAKAKRQAKAKAEAERQAKIKAEAERQAKAKTGGEPRHSFIRIPAGWFWMGSRKTENDESNSDEQPQHRVKLPEYFIGRYPVTNAQYAAFVQATGHEWSPEKEWQIWVKEKSNHPVTYVTWDDVVVFCHWLSGKIGQSVRLPTEAEWEKAAQGTYGRTYPWGNQAPTEKLCNFNRNLGDTTPVGCYSPQGDTFHGAADMVGNVWEWVADWYGVDYYAVSPSTSPTGPASGSRRVVRGGDWSVDSNHVHAASRGKFVPTVTSNNIGFRCAFCYNVP